MPPLKLFFDECCSKRIPLKLLDVFKEDYPEFQTKHLCEYTSSGTSDSVWLPQLAQEGDWIVITSDKGRDTKKPQLPIYCRDLKITHVIFTSKILTAGLIAHKQAFYCLWPQIVKIPLLPKGTRINLGYRPFGHAIWPNLTIERTQFASWCAKHGIV